MTDITINQRPISFNDEMVNAILEGRKTQTRRVVKPQPEHDTDYPYHIGVGRDRRARHCPYGQPGDLLWVRGTNISITLRVTGVLIERVQDISEADALAEGIAAAPTGTGGYMDYTIGPQFMHSVPAVYSFKTLWDSIYAKRDFGWNTNPWVWVIEFERVTP